MTHYTLTCSADGLIEHGILPNGFVPYWVDNGVAIFGREANSPLHAKVMLESHFEGKGLFGKEITVKV